MNIHVDWSMHVCLALHITCIRHVYAARNDNYEIESVVYGSFNEYVGNLFLAVRNGSG